MLHILLLKLSFSSYFPYNTPMITLIVAINHTNSIGLNNRLPWHNPDELQYFKQLTMSKTLYVGHNTYKHLPPLQGRNIKVIGHNKDVQDFHTFLLDHQDSKEDIYIIGGASIFNQALPYASYIYLSIVDDNTLGDCLFNYNPSLYTHTLLQKHTTFTSYLLTKKE